MGSAKIIVATAGALLACGLVREAESSERAPVRPGGGVPIVVELFSSEGCSSCPPMDGFLRGLDARQPIAGINIVALELHVDYWNDLGWRDPFSSADFSARQREYSRRLSEHHVFTPEVIIQGSYVLDGSRDAATERIRAEARRPLAHVDVARKGDMVTVRITDAPPIAAGDKAEVWLAIAEAGLSSHIAAGENQGRTIEHAPIVRRLERLGEMALDSFSGRSRVHAEPGWNPEQLRFVVGSRSIAFALVDPGI